MMRSFSVRVFFKHKVRMDCDCHVFKFLRRDVNGASVLSFKRVTCVVPF